MRVDDSEDEGAGLNARVRAHAHASTTSRTPRAPALGVVNELEGDFSEAFETGTNEDTNLPDLYAVLGVKRDATLQEITKAYRKLAARFHPDRRSGEDDGAFAEVARAYETLRDANKRAFYDSGGAMEVRRSTRCSCLI